MENIILSLLILIGIASFIKAVNEHLDKRRKDDNRGKGTDDDRGEETDETFM